MVDGRLLQPRAAFAQTCADEELGEGAELVWDDE
jgi:hypothetical protein